MHKVGENEQQVQSSDDKIVAHGDVEKTSRSLRTKTRELANDMRSNVRRIRRVHFAHTYILFLRTQILNFRFKFYFISAHMFVFCLFVRLQ